jgi:hypothetical protein
MDNPWVRGDVSADFINWKRAGLSLTSYGVEYFGTSYVKGNYQGFYHEGWEKKAIASAYKAMMYSLMLR